MLHQAGALAGSLLSQFLEDGQIGVDMIEHAVGKASADQRVLQLEALRKRGCAAR
jgi:hypothetical protein